MSYFIKWNELPLKRLQQIYNYIAYKKLEPESAEKLINDIFDFVDVLKHQPSVYMIIISISKGKLKYRSITYLKRYRIIYHIDENNKTVIIDNLFHNSRNPGNLLK